MGLFSDKCPHCDAKVRKGATFCPDCGKPIVAAEASVACRSCGKQVKAGAKFCKFCGTPLAKSSDTLNRWRRSANEFARRVDVGDLVTLVRHGLVVEPGTEALIFERGELTTTITEGTYEFRKPDEEPDATQTASGWQKLIQRVKEFFVGPDQPQPKAQLPATAILVDSGETRLRLECPGLRTQEEIQVDAEAEVAVRLLDAAAVYTNLMHGRETLAISDLAEMLRKDSLNALQARVKSAPVKDLDGNLDFKAALENDLRDHVSAALSRNGLELVQLQRVSFSSKDYEEVRDQRAEMAVAEQGQENLERRAQLHQRLRETLTKERMDKFTTGKDFEQFVRQTEHELGMKEIMRQEELEELKRTYEENKEDAEIARRHLLEKIELEQAGETRRMKHTAEHEELEHELQKKRTGRTGETEDLEHKIDQQAKVGDACREEDLKDVQHGQQVGDVQRETRTKDEEADLALKEKKLKLGMEAREQKIALDDQEESQRIQREQEEKDREARRELEAREREAKRELEKIRTLSDAEQVRLATDLKKTEHMKDMSEDQIMALMAKDSPHVAAAIAERAKAQAQAGTNQETRQLYEKILAEKDASADRIERFAKQALESVERVAGAGVAREQQQKQELVDMGERTMDRMGEVATAKASAPGGQTADESTTVVCPKCQRQAATGTKFCDNCGHQFFE